MYLHYFEKLEVWQKSVYLSVNVYKLTASFPSEEKFGIVNQLRRAATGISANISEGVSRKTKDDEAHFVNLAYSSCMEVLNFLIISFRLQYITKSEYEETRERLEHLGNMLNSFYKVVKNR